MMQHKFNIQKKIGIIVTAVIIIAAVAVAYFTGYGGFGENNITPGGFDRSQDFIKVIDVGQGESILIYSNGYAALFDVGESDSANKICSALSEYDIKRIDVIMISHLHTDHIGGLKNVMELYPADNVVLPELSTESEGLGLAQYAINKLTKEGGKIYTAIPGMNFSIGEFEITVLAAYEGMDNENNSSIIAVAEIDGKKFMFTGDAETKVEKMLLKEGLNLKCDILSVGHHGSNTSSSDEFLKAVRPRYAVISAGLNNMYGHPHNNVLSALENVDAKIFRTDLQGDIIFSFSGGSISVKTGN